MERLVLVGVVVLVAVVVALVAQRRRPDAPTAPRWEVPTQLDRADFDRPEAPWLVAVFSSMTCEACERVLAGAAPLASKEVVVVDLEVSQRGDLHRRYRIDAVPITVVADAEGVVRASYVGPLSATELWSTVASLRAATEGLSPG